jgi:predicted transcriptional regulator
MNTDNNTPEQLLNEIKKCLTNGGEFGYFPFIPAGYYLIYPHNQAEYKLVDTETLKELFSRGLIEKDTERDNNQHQCMYKLVEKPKKNRITRKRTQLLQLIRLGIQTAREISRICGRTANSISQMLKRMLKAGFIKIVKQGTYEMIDNAQLAWNF